MLSCRYTGKLPSASSPEEMLRMIRLADQYQVNRFLSACNASFDKLTLDSLDLGLVLSVFQLPSLMLDSDALAKVLQKVKDKIQDVFGDLEKVSTLDWTCNTMLLSAIQPPKDAAQQGTHYK